MAGGENKYKTCQPKQDVLHATGAHILLAAFDMASCGVDIRDSEGIPNKVDALLRVTCRVLLDLFGLGDVVFFMLLCQTRTGTFGTEVVSAKALSFSPLLFFFMAL